MRIIDAHLHFCRADDYFDEIAQAAGHENTALHLRKEFEKYGIECGVVMGNRDLLPEHHRYPGFLRYCIGLDSFWLGQAEKGIAGAADQVEWHLRQESCVGIKLYPGYCHSYVSDPAYGPIYELAVRYRKPVAVHTGATSAPDALLPYCHPLTLDRAAVEHPNVQFILCHFGNPWLADAAAVLQKNENTAADLSGLLAGRVDIPRLFEKDQGYLGMLRAWMGYLGRYDKLLYGTDWPLVNIGEYLTFIRRLVPEQHYEKVFFENANRVYRLGL